MKSPLRFAFLLALLASSPAFAQQNGGTGPNYETRLSAIEDEVRTLGGRVEQVEFATKRLEQAMQRMQSDTDARLTKLETATPPVPQPQPQPASQPVQSPVSGNIAAPPPVVANNTKAPAPNAQTDDGTPAEQYEEAFDLLRQANYEDAEKAFRAFIDRNPKDKLIDNAKYWYGETLYVRGKFAESAAAFADAYQQNAKGNKAPDSLLKLAMSLSALNKAQDACTALAELKGKYPGASVSVRSRADEERTKLKCAP